MSLHDNSANPGFSEDKLVGTCRLHPAIEGRRAILNPTAGQFNIALGYSDYAFGQVGGNIESGTEPRRGCKTDNRLHDVHSACVHYIGNGAEDTAPAEEDADHDGYYQRIAYLPLCFKIDPKATYIFNETSADVTLSLGDDTENDEDAIKYYAEELTIPAGQLRCLATEELIPLQLSKPRRIGDKLSDGDTTNCHQWLIAKFSTPVAKGECVRFFLNGSAQTA